MTSRRYSKTSALSMQHVNRPDIVLLIERGVEELARKLDGYDSDDEDSTMELCSDSQWVVQDSYFQKAQKEKMEVLSDIENYLKEHAKGVVLWVITVLTILKKSCKEEPLYDLKAMKRHLEGLPLELRDLYHRIATDLLESFKGNHTTLEKSRRALMWVSIPTRYPLQIQDLLEIISFNFNTNGKEEREGMMGGFSDWVSLKRSIG
jgi:hypothetical protein